MQYKIYNADCMDVLRTINQESVDCIVTDPPFGVNYKQNFYDDKMEEVFKLVPLWYSNMFRVLKEQSYLFVFVGVKNIEIWIKEGREAGFLFKNIIATRAFNNGSKIKNNFSFVFQPILLFSKGKGRAFNEVDFFPTSYAWLADPRNTKKEAYQYQYPNFVLPTVAFGTEKFGSNKKKIIHPNAKSEPLCRFFIEIATNRGEIVLDPFMGSGTVGEATIKVGRKFIGIEKDEKYFNMAKNRIEKAMAMPKQGELFNG